MIDLRFRGRSPSAAPFFAMVVFLGVTVSFGFQQGGPGGGGVVVDDYVYNGTSAPATAGHCYTRDPITGIFTVRTFVNVPGRCESGLPCAPEATCLPVANITNNPLVPEGCNFAKTVGSVMVGTCVATTNTQCESCPDLLVCHIYQLFETRNQATGICQNPCGHFVVKFGGQCVYNGTP